MERCRDCYGNRRAEHRAKSGADRHQGRWEGRNLNATFTELRRTGRQGAASLLENWILEGDEEGNFPVNAFVFLSIVFGFIFFGTK